MGRFLTMPIKRGYGTYWEAYSRKAQKRLAFFSDLEFEHFLLVEFDVTILNFTPQPQLDGVEFVPDMLVEFRDGSRQMREVKYAGTLKQPKVCDQIAQQVEWCRINELPHAVITETQIRKNRIWLINCRLMLAQVSLSKVQPLYRQLALELLLDGKPKSFCELYKFVAEGEREVFRQNLLILVQDGVVQTDLTEHLLSMKTRFIFR
jgi:hypothetical protein